MILTLMLTMTTTLKKDNSWILISFVLSSNAQEGMAMWSLALFEFIWKHRALINALYMDCETTVGSFF